MRGEELEGGEAAEIAPVGSVAGGSKGGVMVGEVLAGGEFGAVCEDEVVGGKALIGSYGR